MKIQAIKLLAFKSYVGIELPTDAARVFVAGVNGSGKTSIREALKWAFTGKCQGLDGKGSGGDLLIPTGQSSAAVSLDLKIRGEVDRTLKTFSAFGFSGDKTTQQAALYLKLNTSEAFLQACLDSSVFLALHHAEAKALILDLLNVRVPIPKTEYQKGEVFNTLDTIAVPLAELDAKYKTAFEDRKVAKIKAKAFQTPMKPEGEFPTLERIDAQLKVRREELAALHQQIGETKGRRNQILHRTYEIGVVPSMFKAPITELDLAMQIEDLEERLSVMEADAVPEDPIPMVQPPKKGAIDVEDLKSRILTLTAFQPTKGCIIDGRVECKTHKLKFVNRGKDLQAHVDESGAESVPSAPQTPVPNPITAVRKELDGLKAMQAAYVHAAAQNAERQAELDRLTNELSSLPDTSEVETAIADLQQRIQKGETLRRDSDAHQKAGLAYEAGVLHAKSLADEVTRLETLCEVLGPSGARVGALQAALDPFLSAVNAFTGGFGWTVTLSVDPWGVSVNGRPVETYSRSESYRIGIAIQLAIAKLSGLSFAVVDEVDILDTQNREVMGRLLLAADLEQVIILSTKDAATPLPVVSGMVCYRLANHDGRSVIVETSGG